MNTPVVCAIVVTYNPGSVVVHNIETLLAQVDHVVLVDNGSLAQTDSYLLPLAAGEGCTLIRNSENLGIAAALNIGLLWAIKASYQWIATFDQDSCVSDNFISRMLDTYHQATEKKGIALIAPQCVDAKSGVRGRLMKGHNQEILAAMTSGNVIPTSTFEKIGVFDETLFMDYVDIEFCLRARRSGMRILQSPAVLFHSLGNTTYHCVLGQSFGATNHSAARRYYITRNRLRLLGRFATDWRWAWREIRAILFEIAKIVLVEENKLEKFRAILHGVVGAITCRYGKRIEI
jgi:rhamnosyltransferase